MNMRTKVITNIELLKKLEPILRDREVLNILGSTDIISWYRIEYKTLTLEEMIELMPPRITIGKNKDGYFIKLTNFDGSYILFKRETLFESCEKMLEYLIDEKLLISVEK